ncbi:proton-coupled amino acid transporter-like protein pathetic [Vespa velutina]|uniref:proton-coupled amino acid transporter-like protein pathetic n=1 Tax=Vespa velutina TaxID=202808 RepID=UPI001FB21631|nr:proton-coupled amino acid transporter-like protein pathetic [Vespa velutina]
MGKMEKEIELSSNDSMKNFSSSTKISTISIGDYNEKDEFYDPFENRDKKHTNSDLGSLAHLLKSSLGTGILAMPNAIRNGGLLIGGLGTIIIGIICAHCVHILVRSSHILCKRTKTPKMTYAETAYAAFLCGPKILRPWANASKIFVNTALCATYIGGSCVYIVFIATTIHQVAEHYNGQNTINKGQLMLALIPAVILLGQIRNLKYMVPFSMVANISMMVGFSVTLYYIFKDIQPIDKVEMFSSTEQLPIFFATVVFAIEGIGVVMPVENSMKTPQHFLGCPGVLNITMTIVVGLYAMIGIFGYLAYGDKTEATVTLNIPVEDILGQVVKLLIGLAVLFTYGLQLYVPLDIMWNAIRTKFSHKYEALGETTLRGLVVLLTVGVAVSVQELEPFISLVGAIFFSILGISIPVMVETISCWDGHLGTFKWRLIKNIMLLIFSLMALIFGSWISIKDIIKAYKKH